MKEKSWKKDKITFGEICFVKYQVSLITDCMVIRCCVVVVENQIRYSIIINVSWDAVVLLIKGRRDEVYMVYGLMR